MCGLTGFITGISTGRPDLQSAVRRMNDALKHRGPDTADTWLEPDSGLALAHRRLSIIDLSPEGRQPMESFSGRYVIIFNGEIYNYLDLKPDLENKGVKFRGRSDTEVLLACVEVYGLNMTLQKINGMFAFALWDKKSRTLHFARDRFGKKPLYMGWAGKTLVFGSELKALRAHPDFKPEINPGSLSLYMKYGYVPAPPCIYKNIWSLPAGHRLSVPAEPLMSGENLADLMEPHWNHLRAMEEARGKLDPKKTDADAIEEFSELLDRCVRDRLMSDVPLGAFLSGGIDSSAVVAMMQANSSRPVKTYTIGFQEQGFDEAVFAKKVAQHLGTDHHELYLSGSDAMNVVPLLPDIYDEPFADISAIPTYLVSKFAREDVTVALSGDGGDEMLGGYRRHITGPKVWSKVKYMPRSLRKIAANTVQNISVERWNSLRPSHPQFGSAVHKAAAMISLNTQEEMHNHLVGQNADSFLLNDAMPETFLENPAWQPRGLNFAEKMMYRDALSYLPNDILVKVDRATMAASLEGRAPLLDYRIYNYAWSLPEKFKIRNGKGKWLLREVLKKYVPENLFDRPKQGFAIPADEWLRGPLKDWAVSLLDEQKLDGFNIPAIRKTWDAHQNGQGNHAGRLWTLLMLQSWREKWL